ncbi:MAG: DinB family protein [Phycicoccus sp.]
MTPEDPSAPSAADIGASRSDAAAQLPNDPAETLLGYLARGREALRWKLDGLSEYDLRRPLTPTGTNLLGIVKHVASTELGYFTDVLGRPSGIPLPWLEDDAEDEADMWATPEESTASVLELYDAAAEHTERNVRELGLDAVGEVPWWPPERQRVTVHLLLTHLIAETHRHAGHADIVRELVDGAAGMLVSAVNLPDRDAAWWAAHRERVAAAARQASGTTAADPGRRAASPGARACRSKAAPQ